MLKKIIYLYVIIVYYIFMIEESRLAVKCSMLLSRAIYDVLESDRRHTFAVTLSFTPCGDHQTLLLLLQ